MSFERYPDYKNSEVDGLDEVPRHWAVSSFRHIIGSIESGTSVNATDTPAAEGQVGVLKTSCVYTNRFRIEENKAVVAEEVGRVSCPLRNDTLIVSRMNTPDLVGAAGLVEQASHDIYLPDRLWQVSFVEANPRFVYYWTQSQLYRDNVKLACSGTSSSMQNLGQDQFKSFPVVIPPAAEQSLVSAFLDRETAKIDALVAEQEKLIALLKEKRQAVISHAVTKGLDPDAPMKASGIEWLGCVPKSWEIWKVSHAFTAVGSGTTPPSSETEWYEDGDVPWVTTGELRETTIVATSKNVTRDALARFSVLRTYPSGSLVIAMYGATVGRVGLLGVAGTTNQACCVLSGPRYLSARFMFYWFQAFRNVLVGIFATGGGQPNISSDVISSLRVAAPTKTAQDVIVEYLDREVALIDRLMSESKQAIALLRERRSALISAAVTGKIDVRGLASAPDLKS